LVGKPLIPENLRRQGASVVLGLAELVVVERRDDRTFTGRCLPGATGRIFGGQIAAQSLHAAVGTAPPDREVQSLHCWFLRPGDPDTAVTYTTTVLKGGRSLTTVRVDCTQGDRLIFSATASFHAREPGASYQDPAPGAPEPLLCSPVDMVLPGTNPDVRTPVEFRYPDEASTSQEPAPPHQLTWLRSRTGLGDDPAVHACVLTYLSDLTLTRTAHMPLRRPGIVRIGASLDHTVWFHRAFRADEWLLFDQETTSYAGARALSHGRLFTADGVLVASVAQEALIRVAH
jgi:acyl-CoA thioesterase-2